MSRCLSVVCALTASLGLPLTALAQTLGQPDEYRREKLPSWLKLGVELRGRAESGNAFDSVPQESLFLNRLRFDISIQPAPGIRFFLQGQDARAVGSATGRDPHAWRNTFDVRQAYVDFGTTEEGWQLRVGRQELTLGDERLVGSDNYWDTFGQAFDAVRLGYSTERFRMDAFTGFRVQPADRRFDRLDTASRISGLAFQIKTRGEGVVEPYLLWKRGGDTFDLRGAPGHRDVLTPGIRAQAMLPRGLDYNIEMALQRGHVVADPISAWAGHWELGWRPLGKASGPRIGIEYNFASGDNLSGDHRHGTFDDLYPAGFNKYGMTDPIAWRNIRYPAAGVELPLSRRWTVYAGCRHFQLANINDGLYPGGDQYMVRNPTATSTNVGDHVLLSAAYIHSSHWRLYGGYGYIFPGAYLLQSGYHTPLRTAYLQSSLTF